MGRAGRLVVLGASKAALCLLFGAHGLAGCLGADLVLGTCLETAGSTGVALLVAGVLGRVERGAGWATGLGYAALVHLAHPGAGVWLRGVCRAETRDGLGVYGEAAGLGLVLGSLLSLAAGGQRAVVFDEGVGLGVVGCALVRAWADAGREGDGGAGLGRGEGVLCPLLVLLAAAAQTWLAGLSWGAWVLDTALLVLALFRMASRSLGRPRVALSALGALALGVCVARLAGPGPWPQRALVPLLALWEGTMVALSPAPVVRRSLRGLVGAAVRAGRDGELGTGTVRALVADLEASGMLSGLGGREAREARRAAETCGVEGHRDEERRVALFARLAEAAFLRGDAYRALPAVLALAVRAAAGARLVVLRRGGCEVCRTGASEAGLRPSRLSCGASTLDLLTARALAPPAEADAAGLLRVQEASLGLHAAQQARQATRALLRRFLATHLGRDPAADAVGGVVRRAFCALAANHGLTGGDLALVGLLVDFLGPARASGRRGAGPLALAGERASFGLHRTLKAAAHLAGPSTLARGVSLLVDPRLPALLTGPVHALRYTVVRLLWDLAPDHGSVAIRAGPAGERLLGLAGLSGESGLHLCVRLRLLADAPSCDPPRRWARRELTDGGVVLVHSGERALGGRRLWVRTAHALFRPLFGAVQAPLLANVSGGSRAQHLPLLERLVLARAGAGACSVTVLATTSARGLLVADLLRALTRLPVAVLAPAPAGEWEAPPAGSVLLADAALAPLARAAFPGHAVAVLAPGEVLTPASLFGAFGAGCL